MKSPYPFAAIAAMAAIAGFSAAPARALVTLEDGLDQVFIDGSFGVAYDSNVFANSASGGSVTETASVSISYVRRAGWIGVNANLGWSATDFDQYAAQNFLDPNLSVEFTKDTGRTTGSLTFSAQREDRADIDVNTRDTSWNYNVGLNFKYPVIERYSIAGSFGYSYVDYENRALFTNLAAYTGGLDLYYILSDARDLFAGYKYTYDESSNTDYDIDHDVHVGVSGRIFPKINGSVSVGYTVRDPHGNGSGSGGDSSESDYSASGSATWNVDRKLAITGNVSKAFGITATDTSTDTTSAGLNATDALNAKLSLMGGIAVSDTRFLGAGGEISPGGPQRHDDAFNANFAISYTLNSHLKAALGYSFARNWSNFAFADFPHETVNFNVSSHW